MFTGTFVKPNPLPVISVAVRDPSMTVFTFISSCSAVIAATAPSEDI